MKWEYLREGGEYIDDKHMDMLGDEGWELVSLIRGFENCYEYAIFKRPVAKHTTALRKLAE